jgi:ADP-heptose:LPS heptosyltransferase
MKFFFGKGVWASKRARRIIGDKSRQDIRSVAVIRHAALGDMVLTRCLLREIRTFFPNASLTLSLVSHFTYGAPTDQVDRVHVLHAGGQRDVSLLERLHGIRELGYHDILFDVAATNRSMKVCLLNSAWLKVGFPYHAWQRQLIYDVSVPRSDLQFEADTMLNMLNALGCQTDYPPRFDLPAAPAGRGKPYVVYFTGAAVPDKCWPALHFTRLIALMAAEYPDCEHVVIEGINDWESIAPIIGYPLGRYLLLHVAVSLLAEVRPARGGVRFRWQRTGCRVCSRRGPQTHGLSPGCPYPYPILPRPAAFCSGWALPNRRP